MKHSKKIRVIAAILACVLAIVPGAFSSFADSTTTGESSVTPSSPDSSRSSLAELLSTIDYQEYSDKYVDVPSAAASVLIEKDKIISYDSSVTSAAGVKALTLDDGSQVLYLPADGIVGWSVDFPETAMYNMVITYAPVEEINSASQKTESKTTSIERTLYVNGKVPFYEARFLTMTKTWADDLTSFQLDADGNTIYKYMKGGKIVYPYVDVNGNVLKPDTSSKRLEFVKTGEKVDENKVASEKLTKYPVFVNDINNNEIKSDKKLYLPTATSYHIDALNYDIKVGQKDKYYAIDSTGHVIDSLKFYFNAGKNTIAFDAQRESMVIYSIEFTPVTNPISYEEYLKLHSDAKDYTGSEVKVQAEYPLSASENTIYATNDTTAFITEPQDASQLLLNAIGGDGGEKWQNVGQWVRWNLNVPETGWYQITLRFKQSVLQGTFSSRTLRVATASMLAAGIPAEIPFAEARYLQFNYSDDWQTGVINDGTTEFKIYLEKGDNTVELFASLGNMAKIISRVEASMKTINAIYIKILMITGATPDANRDYGFYRVMPDDVDELLRQAHELVAISDEFQKVTKSAGSHAKTLNKVALLLERMGSDENKIASNLKNLKANLGTLGTWLQTSASQPLEIDYIVAEAPGTNVKKAHKANDNFFQSLWFEMIRFARSFVSDYNTLGAMEIVGKENKVEVWTTLGRDQAMIIRNLINSDFNKNHPGISVELKLVAGGSLLPSVLAGVGPDVSMGHGSGDVMNWAIRNAVVPLTDMPGVEEVCGKYDPVEGFLGGRFADDGSFVDGYFTKAAIEPLELFGEFQDGTSRVDLYGLPETQGFAMMFYRADIFQNLGLKPPTTWDELIAILPVFQNNHMEVALPSSLGGLNLFNYQMGGNLYEDNGKRIGIDTDVALTAFEYMCSFFSKYKCPYTYDFANRFRTGEIPLGIMDYTAYTQLSVYATEIKGLWEFVALPGSLLFDDDGNVIGTSNSAVSGVSSLIMLHDDKRSEEQQNSAWEYMKWYVGAQNQSSYANELTALLGTVSKHATANVEALSSLSWTTSEFKNLMSQFKNLKAVREYPGGYIIGRYVSFAFLAVYNDNADPTESLLDYIVEINKEITRKRKEFDMTYYDITYTTSFVEAAK